MAREWRTSDREDRQSDALTHGALVHEQVAEVYAFEHIVDLALQHHPHRPDAAALRLGAPLLSDGVRDTVQVERGELGRGNDLANRDLMGAARQRIAAASATRAAHETGPAEPKKNLLDVVGRKALASGDLAPGDGTFPCAPREMQRADQSVLGPRSNAHVVKLQPTHDECECDFGH